MVRNFKIQFNNLGQNIYFKWEKILYFNSNYFYKFKKNENDNSSLRETIEELIEENK